MKKQEFEKAINDSFKKLVAKDEKESKEQKDKQAHEKNKQALNGFFSRF